MLGTQIEMTNVFPLSSLSSTFHWSTRGNGLDLRRLSTFGILLVHRCPSQPCAPGAPQVPLAHQKCLFSSTDVSGVGRNEAVFSLPAAATSGKGPGRRSFLYNTNRKRVFIPWLSTSVAMSGSLTLLFLFSRFQPATPSAFGSSAHAPALPAQLCRFQPSGTFRSLPGPRASEAHRDRNAQASGDRVEMAKPF